MADQPVFQQSRVTDADGNPVPGALARFYTPGTLSPVDVFLDEAMTVLAPSPLVANAAGVFRQIWTNAAVKVNVTTAAGETVPGYPLDPAPRSIGGVGAAGSVSFTPSAALPFDNVQEALDGLAERVGTVTDAGRALLDDASATAQLVTLLGAIAAPQVAALGLAAPVITNWNNVKAGFWQEDGTATNGLGFALVGVCIEVGPITKFVLAGRVGADQVYTRRQLAGTWTDWVKVYPSGIGFDQTWQAPSRTAGTSYQNTTGRTIIANITINDESDTAQVSVDNSTWVTVGTGAGTGGGETNTVTVHVPPSHYYKASAFALWRELR